jgi:hypothetical protein
VNLLTFRISTFAHRIGDEAHQMFGFNASATNHLKRHRPTLLVVLAVSATHTIAWVSLLPQPVTAFDADPKPGQTTPAVRAKDAGGGDGAAERKLLADIAAADYALADHYDYSRVDRELATAFHGSGLDLDVVDPDVAGARLAGHPMTPEIAAAIDEWCGIRKFRLKVPTWQRLALVARAADPDPWRNAVREQLDRPPTESLPALRTKAADRHALEKQPLGSLLFLSSLRTEDHDWSTAQAVLRVARRRFPGDFWSLLALADLLSDDEPDPDPSQAVHLCTAAVVMRPGSSMAHLYLAQVGRCPTTRATRESSVTTR